MMDKVDTYLGYFSKIPIRVSLHFSISHLKRRSKIALAMPPTAPVA